MAETATTNRQSLSQIPVYIPHDGGPIEHLTTPDESSSIYHGDTSLNQPQHPSHSAYPAGSVQRRYFEPHPPNSSMVLPVPPLEMEPPPGTPEWKKRKGWFKNTRTHHRLANQHQDQSNQEHLDGSDVTFYRGGPMAMLEQTTLIPAAPLSSSTNGQVEPASVTLRKSEDNLDSASTTPKRHYAMQQEPEPGNAQPLQRISSMMTKSSTDSLLDFDESEWTPADSSYGAAIPVMGWIPKKIRRMIEYSLIGVGVLLLVYLVVFTSLQMTDGQQNSDSSGNKKNDGGLNLDDDRYVPAHNYNDDQYASYNYYNMSSNDDDYNQQQQRYSNDDQGGGYNRRYYNYNDQAAVNDDNYGERSLRYVTSTTKPRKRVGLAERIESAFRYGRQRTIDDPDEEDTET